VSFGVELVPRLLEIIRWYVDGTDHGIKVGGDGLVSCGARLTWMDGDVDGMPVTPRNGKPCEVNALWHNALCVVSALCEEAGRDVWFGEYIDRVRENYWKFWNDEFECLFDVIDPHDESPRPNQVIGFLFELKNNHNHKLKGNQKNIIPHPKKVVEFVQRNLLTSRGLRTLAPWYRGYKGRYVGGWNDRNLAYHQGSVWTWLLGPFVRGYTGVKSTTQLPKKLLLGFLPHLEEAGIGTVSELFDGDEPHIPRGCISQAWSVAELLRCCVEDV